MKDLGRDSSPPIIMTTSKIVTYSYSGCVWLLSGCSREEGVHACLWLWHLCSISKWCRNIVMSIQSPRCLVKWYDLFYTFPCKIETDQRLPIKGTTALFLFVLILFLPMLLLGSGRALTCTATRTCESRRQLLNFDVLFICAWDVTHEGNNSMLANMYFLVKENTTECRVCSLELWVETHCRQL